MRHQKVERQSLYAEVTSRIIAELEEGRLPWVQPWDRAACGCTMPQNAGTARKYSGINVLILWAVFLSARFDGTSYGELAERHGITIEEVTDDFASALVMWSRCLHARLPHLVWPWL